MAFVPRLFSINYSVKNIPLVSKFQYQKQLTFRIEDLIRRMRWRLFWWKRKRKGVEKETYGFKTMMKPPPDEDLRAFEHDLIGLVSEIEMRNVSNELQKTLKRDLRAINNLNNDIIVAADKTGNSYGV